MMDAKVMANNANNGCQIKVITKLPNSEQSYKGKVKTHKQTKSVNNRKTVKT